jgi:hypothetical protein
MIPGIIGNIPPSDLSVDGVSDHDRPSVAFRSDLLGGDIGAHLGRGRHGVPDGGPGDAADDQADGAGHDRAGHGARHGARDCPAMLFLDDGRVVDGGLVRVRLSQHRPRQQGGAATEN